MRLLMGLALIAPFLTAADESSAQKTWEDLAAKRAALPGFHQEFEVTATLRYARTQTSKYAEVIDARPGAWRETYSDGGGRILIFDGKETLSLEEDGDEYVRTVVAAGEKTEPPMYTTETADWAKATEKERVLCGLPGRDHECVLLDVPLKPGYRATTTSVTSMFQGDVRVLVDTETGLIVEQHVLRAYDKRTATYETELSIVLRRMGYGTAPDASLFRLPSSAVHPVKVLSRWNAARIRKQLTGQPAPVVELRDINGNRVDPADLKGKTVLLDFWSTWCQPCHTDDPALAKLHRKYGSKELVVIGIAMDEDRPVVENYLHSHKHDFPVALSSENELPRSYVVGLLPTYIVIGKDGRLSTAAEGPHGLEGVRKALHQAGIDID
jgi:thiol-disulfide isomerase/thioredoxin/outer membrane lipoprotein-sorting protein